MFFVCDSRTQKTLSPCISSSHVCAFQSENKQKKHSLPFINVVSHLLITTKKKKNKLKEKILKLLFTSFTFIFHFRFTFEISFDCRSFFIYILLLLYSVEWSMHAHDIYPFKCWCWPFTHTHTQTRFHTYAHIHSQCWKKLLKKDIHWCLLFLVDVNINALIRVYFY